MEGQQVQVEIIATNIEVNLAADESESGPELPKGFHNAIHQGFFHIPFGNLAGQAKEVEHVWVFRNLLRKLRIAGGQLPNEVGGLGADPLMSAVHDLVHQHVP